MHAPGISVPCFQKSPIYTLEHANPCTPLLSSILQILFYFLILGTLSPKPMAAAFNGRRNREKSGEKQTACQRA